MASHPKMYDDNGSSSSFRSRDEDTNDASCLVNASMFNQWRSKYVDELEFGGWNIDMVKFAIATTYESYGPLKTAIRRGIPDIIKHYIWIKANEADRFYIEHPNFYKNSFEATFGFNVPEEMGDYCPTFCGGLLGLQLDILNTPATPCDLDDNIIGLFFILNIKNADNDTIYSYSRFNSDFGYQPNFWDKFKSLSLFGESKRVLGTKQRGNSATTVIGSQSMSGKFPDLYKDNRDIPLDLDDKKQKKLPKGDGKIQNKNDISEYLSVISSESMNQKRLMKSAMIKIRNLSTDQHKPGINTDKTRQMSDTFIFTKNYEWIPPPPSHHSEIMGSYISIPDHSSAKTTEKKRFLWIRKLFKKLGWMCMIKDKNATHDLTVTSNTNLPLEPNFNYVHQFSAIPEIMGNSTPNMQGSDTSLSRDSETSIPISTLPSGSTISPVTSTMGSNTTLNSSVYKLTDVTYLTILLTDDGIREVKRILWCLNSYFSSKVEFLPIIPSLCCILLIYMSPEAAFCVLYRLILKATNSMGNDCGERFLFCDRKGFMIFVNYVQSLMNSNLRKLVSHLQRLKVDLSAWIARAVQHGFSEILPFDYILRIYGDFLFEGESVFCRYCLALLKVERSRLLKCKRREEAEKILYHIGLSKNLNIDQVTKMAYSFRLRLYDNSYKSLDVISPYFMQVKMKTFYRPRLSAASSIIPDNLWELLWTWILPTYRIFDPEKIYSSDSHGSSMMGLIKRVYESLKKPCPALLFVKTTKLDVFGCFIPILLDSPIKGHFTPTDGTSQQNTFVFTLSNPEKIYRWTGNNTTGIKISKDGIIVGARDPAFVLDKALGNGHTAPSVSFNSPCLVSSNTGYFSTLLLELWTLT
ncbi:hypothetical protein BEWA_008570 [Theileria equi strain WA]|uniref:TLDc domain-containing protein n=1 Tax=Theileria equi strain WA TaxID=1537102 RepID=L0B0S5_THEEQ|nr:hypothetical protein BEWA_008570 [Theileria equi strain WA]AFZ81447.1 hypothetical protein BEWA_008570 [Theileria equi strain WA]|eukprot:XP_004831113.1 hypothetical protein BEWA_008570 [Theileria equi strain WA]